MTLIILKVSASFQHHGQRLRCCSLEKERLGREKSAETWRQNVLQRRRREYCCSLRGQCTVNLLPIFQRSSCGCTISRWTMLWEGWGLHLASAQGQRLPCALAAEICSAAELCQWRPWSANTVARTGFIASHVTWAHSPSARWFHLLRRLLAKLPYCTLLSCYYGCRVALPKCHKTICSTCWTRFNSINWIKKHLNRQWDDVIIIYMWLCKALLQMLVNNHPPALNNLQ